MLALTKDYESQVKQLKKEVYHLTWYMRGGVSAHVLFNDTDISDLEFLNQITKENIETTKKTGMPLV